MTVPYNEHMSTKQYFRFFRLLFRWDGSFYKLIVKQFTIYFVMSMLFHIVPSFFLTTKQREWFGEFCMQVGRMSGLVVGSVVIALGFFIQQVYKRYCYTFLQVPWPDGFAFLVSVNVRGQDQRGRLLRRTMVRYTVASIIVVWMNFSDRIQEHFPDLESLIVAGFLTENEVALLKSCGRATWR